MSLAEILDHGAPHSWANFRINTLKTDQGITEFTGRINDFSGRISITALTTLLTVPTASNSATLIETNLWIYCTAGPDINTGQCQRLLSRVINVAGVITVTTVVNSAPAGLQTGLVVSGSGSNALVQVTPPVGDTVRYNYYIKTFIDNI